MPIRPENAKRYPKDWKTVVVPRIRARSGNRCECTGQCRSSHGPDRCTRFNGQLVHTNFKSFPVVLTVAHLDHQPENNNDANLLHMCQRCHNRYDAPMRAAGIKARRKAALAAGDLFQCTPAE